MPNLDFYAVGNDLEEVLSFVFEELPVRVFESYSPYDKKIMEFSGISSISERYFLGVCEGTAPSVLLQLWPVRASGKVFFEKINLKMKDHRFRHVISGWGLIQLYLGGTNEKDSKLIHSHTNHNSEKRAQKWEMTYPHYGPVDAWDWEEITAISNRLNRHIKKVSVGKIASSPVLPCAAHLLQGPIIAA